MTPYHSQIQVRFGHCDMAGIVFYPRYFEMFNNLVEDWCHSTGVPYAEIHEGRGTGLPVVHLDVDFRAPSRMGDTLAATLSVREVGSTSLTLEIVLQGPDGAERVRARMVVVLVDLKSKLPVPIPAEVRAKLA
jgi:4-hydroxybenzoyl-CoA thioesterase